ncbi:MAG TPA: DNA-3-methyladenine glycosylase 2 family protein [Blastocatellia bacterium]|nr:DNA-3-methyladenine glycosylase 2 family protein [Blastocatellia bacterium]
MKTPDHSISFGDSLRAAERHLSRRDAMMRQYIKKYGPCQLKPHTRYFDTLVDAIISQQLSTRAAETILNRFKALYAPARFPKAAQILATPDEKLRSVGISGQKISYIKDLSAKTEEGKLRLSGTSRMSDEEIINMLVQVKGIGVWTAHMFMIFSLGRLNVLPVGDLGVRRAIERGYGLAGLPGAAEIEAIAKSRQWHPYCSVAAWFLWRSLENQG